MKIQKSGKIVFVFLISFMLVSCFSKDTQTELEVYTDAYVIKKMINDEPMYAITFYAYGNQMMRSGTVTEIGGSGVRIDLGLNPNSIFTLWKWPSESDFRPYPPSASEYQFSVTAESGLNNESTEYLNPKDIAIPVITKAAFSDNNKLIDVTWNPVAGADGFLVKVAEENANIIYTSDGMLPTITNYTINLLAGNWTKPVEQGNTYTIEVHAFVYEADADDFYKVYNVEEISIGTKSLAWE
jgi:hypothetical protein